MIAALSLFSGVGGWELHDAELGIRTTGIENDPAAADTAEAAGHHVQRQDVTKVTLLPQHGYKILKAGPPCQTFSAAGKGAGRKALDIVLDELARLVARYRGSLCVTGGWKQQTTWIRYDRFSDIRTGLVLEPLRYILAAHLLGQPFQAIALEQVPAVLPVWEAYAVVLRELGYSVAVGIVQAEQHAVPQTRKRAVLVARMDGEARLPIPTHSKYYPRDPSKLDAGVAKWVSMAQALEWGMTQRPYPVVAVGTDAGGTDPQVLGGSRARALVREERESGRWVEKTHDDAPEHWARPFTHMGDVRRPNGTLRTLDQPAATLSASMDNGNYQFVLRNNSSENAAERAQGSGSHPSGVEWAYDRPATTVQGDPRIWPPGHKVNADDRRRLGDEADARYGTRAGPNAMRVSINEAAVLQSFPPDYPWQGTKGQQYQQVGNAIPPLLARAILLQVLS